MQVAIDKLSDTLQRFPHFDRLLALCSTKDVYLVGGAIRDALIGRPVTDLDLIFPDDPTALAKVFARQISGHWFWLDQARCQSRVVVNHDGECLNYDFALFRAPDLERDLLDRDFTINALALPLTEDLSASSLVDPCCGLKDLQQDSLRKVAKDSFANDPLRIIKGVRHATALELKIETETLQAMGHDVAGLELIAPERVRQEVWKIIGDEQAPRGLQLLHECGAGELLFGAGFASSLTELTGHLSACRICWQHFASNEPIVSDWLAQEVEQGLTNEILLLWTFLMSSIESSLPIRLAEKWRLSRKARTNIVAITGLDKAALIEFSCIAHNERAYAWWALRYRIDPQLLLLALAALIGPLGVGPASEELQSWVPLVGRLDDRRPNDLVDGHWLRNELKLKEGPEMTKALQQLRNAEISGQVSNSDEAHEFLKLMGY